jgi:hypothetical protein
MQYIHGSIIDLHLGIPLCWIYNLHPANADKHTRLNGYRKRSPFAHSPALFDSFFFLLVVVIDDIDVMMLIVMMVSILKDIRRIILVHHHTTYQD